MIGPHSRIFASSSLVLIGWLGLSTRALAAAPVPPEAAPRDTKLEASAEITTEEVAPDSPRATMTEFVGHCRKQSFDEAASFLELPRTSDREPADHAERLCAVLQARSRSRLDELSIESTGATDDGLPRNTDVLTEIERDDGSSDPVRIVRRSRQTPAWVFDRTVVAQVDGWYAELDDIWFREHLPEVLLRPGARGLLWWQLLALPLLFAGALLIGVLFERLVASVVGRILGRIWPPLDAQRLRRLRAPLVLLWAIGLVELSVPWLQFGLRGEQFVHQLTHGTLLFALFWLLARTLDLVGELIAGSHWALRHPASRSLVPLGRRIGKVVIVALAIIAFLAELGYPITSLLAGLGIGGLAVALAAQKTVENLFGAFSIGADEPFREGDFVNAGGVVGTVEAIGLRSTKIRTLDRTLVTIPNGKLADMQLESFAVRDRLRLACTIRLVYETTPEQLRVVVRELEQLLRAHPKIWPDAVDVHVVGFGASSIDIEIMAWFLTGSWDVFLDIRQELFLQIAELVPRAGSAFAFPTQTLHMVSSPPDSERA